VFAVFNITLQCQRDILAAAAVALLPMVQKTKTDIRNGQAKA
jgi:hypothetical protein